MPKCLSTDSERVVLYRGLSWRLCRRGAVLDSRADLGLEEVFDFAPKLTWIALKASRVAEFFPTSLHFYPKILLNLFLQMINACLYSRVFNLRALSPKSTFLLN